MLRKGNKATSPLVAAWNEDRWRLAGSLELVGSGDDKGCPFRKPKPAIFGQNAVKVCIAPFRFNGGYDKAMGRPFHRHSTQLTLLIV